MKSYSGVARLGELAYMSQLPYESFWQGLSNFLLINYHEMEINHVLQLIYYIKKAGVVEIQLYPE